MAFETWLTFVLASLVLTITPGPSILLGMVHSLNFGPRLTVYTALGDISANFIQMILVAIGLGVVIASSELAFNIIKWFGVITLLYMGLKMILNKNVKIPDQSAQQTMSRKRMYLSGFMVAAGNPKAIVFFTAFFPQFIDPSQPLFQLMLIMCPTMALLDFTWVMIYAVLAKQSAVFLQRRPSLINGLGGSALIGASGYLAFTSKS